MENLVIKPAKAAMSAYTLKIVAICAMLIDHIAWAFVPTGTLLGQIMHAIGRLTAPIMCYFITEGYYHTHNLKKYALRLGIFALISHIPFGLFETGQLPFPFTNGNYFTGVIYTLFLGLISLIVWNSEKLNKVVKVILIVLICIMAMLGDWFFISVLWVLFFGIYHNNFKKQVLSFSIISIPIVLAPLIMFIGNASKWNEQFFHIGVFLALPLLARYNGELGGGKNAKWIFYVFYPLHLLIIALIKYSNLLAF